ncbi:Single-stranded DNA-binding protein [Mycena indigotica]|uniref:Single-stranded DNA-binding protein n=1 Tax=Mycena indigotica TaxID=2126181 RepID=A0A8H6SLE0_9AGAR|nr:Single-stranded DNA-binding protein [Mycena indigotica]KAF7301551.1 Single-stranded DNA-binding protein [Mycena indigotica]
MFRVATFRPTIRAFSTSARTNDLAKLTLIGNLGKVPELKTTKNEKEYVSYAVATTSSAPPSADGERTFNTTWHRIHSFSHGTNTYLQTLKQGSKVYVEAHYEIREPDPNADPSTPAGPTPNLPPPWSVSPILPQPNDCECSPDTIRVIAPPRPRETEEH